MTDEELREYKKYAKASQGFDVPKFKGKLVGMIVPYNLNEITTPILTDFSKQALRFYNNKNSTGFEFVKVVKATYRLVAGRIYYITFEALSSNVPATFRAREACPGKIAIRKSKLRILYPIRFDKNFADQIEKSTISDPIRFVCGLFICMLINSG
ncbi:hypothetical protein PIB30_051101 [Stylosanthes scabra]|uniref:Cystatin domain-containing protein n=1 Tax=Stylosanthes scabra TaxID=79078 RepID=A0ABU6QI33_9FABA|nr:hypothetical protein [Stylosanthes scabra]